MKAAIFSKLYSGNKERNTVTHLTAQSEAKLSIMKCDWHYVCRQFPNEMLYT